MATSHEDVGLSSKLSDIDKGYLAGLFDGEGCASATFRSKGVILKKGKKVRYFWPTVQFVISGLHSHLQPIQELVGLGGLYQDKKTGVWDFRITQPKQVLKMTNTILPYARLKKEELLTLRKAALFMIRHKRRTRWTKAKLDEFHKRFVLPLKKGGKGGRPTEHKKPFVKDRK